jgi:hypothetical protein
MYQAVTKPMAIAANGLHFTQSGTWWYSLTSSFSGSVNSAPCQNSP